MKKLLFLLIIIFSNMFLYAGDHSFSINIELTQTAINRALAQQYDQSNFPRIVSGNVSALGITYTIYLSRPFIDLLPNSIGINMPIRVESNVGNFDGLNVNPTITIPQSSISTSQATALLLDLPDKINSLSIPDWLKTVLVSTYNSYEPWLYPSKLLNQISSPFLNQRRVNITNIILGWSVNPEKLILKITTNVNSQLPNFSIALDVIDGNAYPDVALILSNIEVTVAEVVVEFGGSVLWHGYPNVTCPKGQSISINMGDIFLASSYTIWVIYKINETFYVREYASVPYYFSGNYYGATKSIN